MCVCVRVGGGRDVQGMHVWFFGGDDDHIRQLADLKRAQAMVQMKRLGTSQSAQLHHLEGSQGS